MSRGSSHSDETLPIQLQIRVLEAELEQIEQDLGRLERFRAQIQDELGHYENLLARKKRHHTLRRVK